MEEAATTTEASTTALDEVTSITWQDILNKIIDWSTNTGIKIVIALLIWIISFKIINFVFKRIAKK